MQRLEVSGAVQPLYESFGVKGLMQYTRVWDGKGSIQQKSDFSC
jgi:hypothetical protein